MTLSDQIAADLLSAMKTKAPRRLAILRLAKAAIKNQEIDKGAPLSDAEIVQVLKKMVKQLEEAIKDFTKGGRSDLVAQNSEELNILQAYLPPELSAEEALKLVLDLISRVMNSIEKRRSS